MTRSPTLLPAVGAHRAPADGKGLRHKTMSAAAAEELRRRILDGSFPSGFQLRQDELAATLGISRIPLREALVQLEAEGLVRIAPHRGAVVSELSIAEIEEIFELRALLEPHLLRLSAPLLTRVDFAELRGILDEYSAELRAKHTGRWGELNTRLHTLLTAHADRPKTVSFCANLLMASDRLTRLQLSLTDGMERAEAEHADLIDLCERGRVADACELLRRHIEHAGTSLLASITSKHQP